MEGARRRSSRLIGPRYMLKRIVQTPRTFANWPQVLRDLALARGGRGPSELRFESRTGLTIHTPNTPGARVPVYEIFADDAYHLDWFLGDLARRPIHVLDIGGHVGTFSCRLTQLHQQAEVDAYEPSAVTAGFLRRNTEQNGVAGRVRVHEAALSSTSGTASFNDNGAGSGLNGLRSTGRSNATAVEVRTVAFDEAVTGADGPVDLVKIDCEGGEYDLVLGSSPDSWQGVRRLVIEYHPAPGHSWAELETFLTATGLTIAHVERGEKHGCVWLTRDPLPALASA